MLGLGNNLTSGAVVSETFTPASVATPTLWLRHNWGITADFDTNGNAVTHNTMAGNMVDGDKLKFWYHYPTYAINANQMGAQGDKPRWEADDNSVYWPAGKYFDLSSTITVNANTDFTVMIRFKPDQASAGALLGSSATEHIRINSATVVRLRADDGGGTAYNTDFTSGTALATDKYITMIIVRSDGATGNINIYVRGVDSGYFDGTAAGTAFGSQDQVTEELVFSNLGAGADDGNNFRGYMKDVIVWNGTAVTETQRKQLFDYIETQGDTGP